MDAQHAARLAIMKPASPKQRPANLLPRSTGPPPVIVARPRKPSDATSAWPNASSIHHTSRSPSDEAALDGNSDAETILLPGRGHHSPSKSRRIIDPESDVDHSDDAPRLRKPSLATKARDSDRSDRIDKNDRTISVAGNGTADGLTSVAKKKRQILEKRPFRDHVTVPIPSTSPTRRRLVPVHSDSESEPPLNKSPRSQAKDKVSSTYDKLVPRRKKSIKAESEDDARVDGASGRPPQRLVSTQIGSRHRSVSPHDKTHRRESSTQLPGRVSQGLGQKKKRLPPPLQTTTYHSDESSTGVSPYHKNSKSRSSHVASAIEPSPAKAAPSHRRLDAHGQTPLSRACAKGEYDMAKQRLADRPEDLDFADYAGNTPLQIASINGWAKIVKLLIARKCNLDCVNNDKDTPLLDAVENGHLDVVKLLLDAGANPRKVNAYGEEPLDRVPHDHELAQKITAALIEAKQRMGSRAHSPDDNQADQRFPHASDSPRRSPGSSAGHPSATGRRAGTVRATKTSNHLLYMPMDDKTLRAAAGRGDEETVTRILNVRDRCDDPEPLVAAAKGGHDVVMQLLLALGKANPDPPPLTGSTYSSEYATPMLAAIGQDNIKVVELLLEQTDFDPTRRINGETYYEIARRRRGVNCVVEERMLKEVYDQRRKPGKYMAKKTSPAQQPRDSGHRGPLRIRSEATKDTATRLAKNKPAISPTEKRLLASSANALDDESHVLRNGIARARKDDRPVSMAASDRDPSPVHNKLKRKETDRDLSSPVYNKMRRKESELAPNNSEGEAIKVRRKLVSGRELKDEREKRQRRVSLASNSSSLKEPSSPHESRFDEISGGNIKSEKATVKSDKMPDRSKISTKEEAKDRHRFLGEIPAKRLRPQDLSPQPGSPEIDNTEVPTKRRKLEPDTTSDRRLKSGSSTEDRPHKPSSLRSSTTASGPTNKSRDKLTREEHDRRVQLKAKRMNSAPLDIGRRDSASQAHGTLEKSIHVKIPDVDTEMRDVHPTGQGRERRMSMQEKRDEDERRRQRIRKKRQEEEERRRLEEEAKERRRRGEEEEEAVEREKQEREAKRRETENRRQEEERCQLDEEEKRRREEIERRLREEEEEKRQREEIERRLREEEEKERQLEEQERQRREEEDRRREKEAMEERRRREEAAAVEKRRQEQEQAANAAAEKCRREEDAAAAAAEKCRREEEAAAAAEKRRHEQEAAAAAAEKRRHEEEAAAAAAAEKRRREEEAAAVAAAEKRRQEQEDMRRREEEEKRRREEEEARCLREEEERRRREQEELRRQQEEEARLLREAEEQRKQAEAEQRRREEEERLCQEREAAEEARRQQEEAERRARAEREAAERRVQEELEAIRLSKLPAVLRWLTKAADAQTPSVASKFSVMQGVRFDCIQPEANGTLGGGEPWLLNTQVALLLGDKDLELARYAKWSRIPASIKAKRTIWHLESGRYALTDHRVMDLGKQIPSYYSDEDPECLSLEVRGRLLREAWEKFAALDQFFIKAADLMSTIPSIPHLRQVKLTIVYRELPEGEFGLAPPEKWKKDPDAPDSNGFAPSDRCYVDGQLVHERRSGTMAVSRLPFAEPRLKPRGGALAMTGRPTSSWSHDATELSACVARSISSNGAVDKAQVSRASTTSCGDEAGHEAYGVNRAACNSTTINGAGLHPLSPASQDGGPTASQPSAPLTNGINGSHR